MSNRVTRRVIIQSPTALRITLQVTRITNITTQLSILPSGPRTQAWHPDKRASCIWRAFHQIHAVGGRTRLIRGLSKQKEYIVMVWVMQPMVCVAQCDLMGQRGAQARHASSTVRESNQRIALNQEFFFFSIKAPTGLKSSTWKVLGYRFLKSFPACSCCQKYDYRSAPLP